MASAQRRRAGGSQNPVQHEKFSRYKGGPAPTGSKESAPGSSVIHIRDAFAILSARTDQLKSTTDTHSEHWEQHDAFLKQVCDKVDSLEERLSILEKLSNIQPEE